MRNMMNLCLLNAKLKLRTFFSKENGDVNVVSIVVLIGVAVLLAMLFKDQIGKLLDSLFKTIIPNAEEAAGTKIT